MQLVSVYVKERFGVCVSMLLMCESCGDVCVYAASSTVACTGTVERAAADAKEKKAKHRFSSMNV